MATSGGQTLGVTISANMDPSGILGAVRQMQGAFNGLKLPANLTGDILKDFNKLQESLKKFESIAKQDHFSKTDLKNLEKLQKEIDSTFSSLKSSFNDLSGQKLYLDADYTKIKEAKTVVDDLKADIQSKLSEIKIDFSSAKGGTASLGLDEMISGMERGVKSSKVLSAAMGEVKQSLQAGNFSAAADQISQIITKSNDLKGAGTGLLNIFKQWGLIDFSTPANELVKTKKGADLLATALGKIVPEIGKDNEAIQQLAQKLQEAVKKKEDLEKTGAANFAKDMSTGAQSAEQLGNAFKTAGQSSREMAQGISQAAEQVKQLQQSTQYFFSLRNMINLLKRGVREAVDVVKELDAAMTETAVVTDFSVGDMWEKLPEYTANANALGASVKDMYEATTLYYQQGLNTAQSMGIAAETMKMARIGGLEAADATDKMTAALRGFNMEINEASAQRVNDVYSNLAAKTASNTEELGTAMQRTASIAASAGMSFEGTAAFLAQAIETTREPAENLGTAMKTIVARFTELKKNPLEITEVDGEEVSYNKVDTALQSIGVSLKDVNGQFRNLDQVFLDISQRWNSLSQTQQRYIATTAAGSRQQSRFIAMMSNYERTAQLMEYANNSAGASNEQFGKTMESLEAKLNKLRNAWQQFEMGIANNSLIKGAVDGLTGFLNLTNTIINKLSLGSGVIKSFLSVFAAFTGLKAMGRVANRLIGGLGGLVDPTSSFKEGFKGGAIKQGQTGTAQAKAISDPIVTAVNRIYGAITGKQATTNQTTQNTTADFKSFKDANTEMRNFLGGLKTNEKFSIAEAYGKIGKLDERQQKAVLQQLPGLQLSLQKNGINFNTADLSDSSSKLIKTFNNEINQGLKNKTIDSQGILQLFGTPENFKRGMEARGPEYVKAAEEVLNKGIDKAKIQDEVLNSKIVERDLLGAKWSDDQILEMAQKEADKKIKTLQENNLKESIKGTASASMQAANDFAAMGQAATMAGQGIAQLGMQLSNAGFERAGQAVTNLGYRISSLGTIASSVGSVVGKIIDNGGLFGKAGLMAAHPVITALIVAVGTLGAVFAAASAKIKKIKEAGEEVTKTFNETNKSVEDNIAKLKSYQSEFATLSKGVDSNGNNVNLDDSQYQRYLEIVDDIATINPEIVEGYNAQGHAIINNNKALAETLKKQQEIRKEVYSTYTSEDSLNTLIRARNVNKDYYESVTNKTKAKGTFVGGTAGQVATGYTSPMTGDVTSIADKLGLIKDFDETVLKKYGIDSLEALESGEEQAVKNFIKHRQQIQADLANSGLKLNESIIKGFDKLGEDTAAFDEAIKPVYDNLLANVSNSKVFESIAPEFRDALNMGLKDLASQDLSASEMSKAANNMAARFANLTTGSGKYKDALDIVEKAQQDFAASLNETEYKADVQPAIDDLTRLKEKALSEGSVYGDALAEYLENQIEQISRFTEEGTISLSEALNTMQDDIAAAEGALSSFQEATKTDYSTAASGMKGIFEEIFKETDSKQLHTEGFGDQTFWKGAKELLSEDIVDTGNIDNVIDKLNKIKPALEDGQDGWENFLDIVENTKGMDKWFKFFDDGTYQIDIPEEEFSEVAKQLGVSENFLTSMLNKGRQFANISFSNVESVRQALATSNSTIKGQIADANGNKNLYVKEDSIRTELFNQGYVTKDDQDKQLKAYLDKGIKTIPAADSKELTKEDWQGFAADWGIKNLPDLIQTLNDTGEFTKDEIKAYAEKMDMLNTDEEFEQDYADIISAVENPELVKQTSELQSINAKVGALLDKRSPEEQKSDWQDFHNMIYGGKGVDTDFQHFARGEDSSGGSLDAGEYETTKHNMQDAAQIAEEASQKYKIMAEQSSGADKQHFEELSEKYDADAQHIKELMAAGEKAYADSQKQIEKERQAAQARNDGRKQEQQTQRQANQNQAKENAQAANEKGKTQTNTIINNTEENKTTHETVIADGETTPAYEEIQQERKYGESNPSYKVSIITDGITTGIDTVQTGLNNLPPTTTTSIITNGITDGITTVQTGLNNLPSSKNISITASDNTGSIISSIRSKLASLAQKALSIGGGGAAGINNTIKTSHVPVFASAAKGKGRVGPKNRGGLTLTGEEGYEIAWLPDEGKSMILGAAGPQMINLPANAVVYTHQQSEDILKKKQTINAGSHGGEVTGGGKRKTKKTIVQSTKGKDTKKKDKGKKKGTGNSDNNNSKKTINNFSIQEVVRFNIDQKLSKLADEIAKRTKEIEKSLEKIGVTYNEIIGSTKEQISALESVKNQNQQLISSYKKQLSDYRGRSADISYTNSKGKTVNKTIKVGTYLNADGSINEDKMRSVKTRAEREAIYKEIQSAKSLTDGMSDAQKAIDDANEKIEELHKKVADTFFNWENEITWVYNLTQKLNNIQSLRDRFSEQINLELDKVATGFKTTADALNNINTVIKRDNQALLDQLEAQKQLIAARKLETEEAYSWADEAEELAYQYSQNADEGIIKSAQQNLDAAKFMQNYIKGYSVREDGTVKYDIDWEKFAQDKSNISTMGITKETYELTKKKLDQLNDAEAEQNNAIKEATALEDQIFQNISNYQQTQVDLESSLLKELEQQQEEEADNLKELGSVISDALSNLLDEVKYKLDMRRQQEDNLKTEADIMGKQRRLAMLRADTSGGNQVEIAQLEKEIADSQQDYQRTLEDQLLDKLQHQADEAAKQRERQIELLEVANEINNDNRELVRKWVENPSLYQSEITEVLKAAQGFEEAGYFEQAQILRDIGKQIVEGQYASTQLQKTDTSKEQQQLNEAETQKAELETQAANVNKQIEAAQIRLMEAQRQIRSIDQRLTANDISIEQKESRLKQLDLQRDRFSSNLHKGDPFARMRLIEIDRERQRLTQQIEGEKAERQSLLQERAHYYGQLRHEQEIIRDLTKDGAYLNQKISATGQLITDTIDTIYDISTSTLPGVIDLVNQFNKANLNIDPTYLNTHGQIVGGGYTTREQNAQAALNTASSQYIARNTPTAATSTTDTGNHAAAGGGPGTTGTAISYPYGKASETSGSIKKGNTGKKVKAIQWALKQMGYKGLKGNALAIDGKFGDNTEHAVKSFQKAMKISQDGIVGDQTRKKFKAKGYKTGGLADYTGPAWLDGTPSKPELVLNAKDTANFIALKDVLAKAMNGIGDTSNTYGDISYEININVDKIEKDYDVDRVVEKVKKEIVKGAGYRNVTQVRSFR